MFDDPLFLTFADPEHSFHEQRFIVIGESAKRRLPVVAHTDRAGTMCFISARPVTRKEREAYKSTSERDDDLSPKYDFTQLPVMARGQRRRRSPLTVQLEPDIAAMFPNAVAVNEGLRLLMRLIQQAPSPSEVQSVTASKDA